MKILYIGDIVARVGRRAVQQILPELKKDRDIDFVIAQSENMSTGNGLTIKAVEELREAGVDFFTGGNHSFKKRDFYPYFDDPKVPVIRPANYPDGTPGRGFAEVDSPMGKLLIISVLGTTFNGPQLKHPLGTIDGILSDHKHKKFTATLVDFHGDLSSEKVAIGYYLNGRVSGVVGSHTHVPTADARILPGGTAVVSDTGMVGPADSVLGVKKEVIIQRWLTQLPTRHDIATHGEVQFNAVLIDVDSHGKARSIEQILEKVEV